MLWSIGHSNHPFERFRDLLKCAGIEAVADVRSRPASRFVPAYNRAALDKSLAVEGIAYMFMGETLGGKPAGSKAPPQYGPRIEQTTFLEGIEALLAATRTQRVAMMCSERHPLDCHRCRLIGRYLQRQGEDVQHILSEGETVTQSALEAELLSGVQTDLFSTEAERLNRAYAWKK